MCSDTDISTYPPLQLFDSSSEAPNNLSYPPDLIELVLQLIDLAKDGSEAGDLGVGHLYRVAGTVILGLGSYFSSPVELHHMSISHAACQPDVYQPAPGAAGSLA